MHQKENAIPRPCKADWALWGVVAAGEVQEVVGGGDNGVDGLLVVEVSTQVHQGRGRWRAERSGRRRLSPQRQVDDPRLLIDLL